MPEYTSSNITAIVPASNQSANMITAFEQYHASIADDIDSKQGSFSGAVSSVISSNLAANYVVVANSTGKISSNTYITTSNLSVLDGLTSQSEILFPPGMISSYIGFDVPDGWLFCNGATILKSSYPNLVDVLTLKAPITSIMINGDNESGEWFVRFYIDSITLPSYSYWSLSLTANAAVRAATRLAEVPNIPESETLFTMGNDVYPSALTFYPNAGQAAFSNEWLNNGIYSVSELNLTINLYGYPTSLNNMILPDFRSRFIYGANAMTNMLFGTGTFQHQHNVTGSARIDFSGSNVFVQEVGVPSWSATERFTISGSVANVSSRTVGVNVIGNSNSITIMPPYFTAKHIIKT